MNAAPRRLCELLKSPGRSGARLAMVRVFFQAVS
jgi:hypothetical protein